MTTNHQTSRRQFIGTVAAGSAGVLLSSSQHAAGYQSPNERPVFATIGLRNQGWAITNKSTRFADFVALADVDSNVLGATAEQLQKTQRKAPDTYSDYRKVLDRKDVDAVMIATPDHWHTKVAVEAMLAGKDVYCEKPLAHTAWECRQLTLIAEKMGVATQLGNQRHANAGMARAVEAVQSGMVGKITEVYTAVGGSRGMPAVPKTFPAVPSHLNWELWQGPVALRKYSPEYCPYKWRFWWDYGTGETGNWGCHILDIPYWALGLKYPRRVDLDVVPKPEEIDPQRTPKSMKTRLEFAAENGHDAVTLHWWHGSLDAVFAKHKAQKYGNTLFLGEKGTISAGFDGYKAVLNDGSTPEAPKASIPKSPGFYTEWIIACKG